MSKLARIYMEGGCVNDVLGLPEDYSYKLIEYNEDEDEDCCGNCELAATCEVDMGNEECKFILHHEIVERQKREAEEKKKRIEGQRNRLEKLTKEQLIQEIMSQIWRKSYE